MILETGHDQKWKWQKIIVFCKHFCLSLQINFLSLPLKFVFSPVEEKVKISTPLKKMKLLIQCTIEILVSFINPWRQILPPLFRNEQCYSKNRKLHKWLLKRPPPWPPPKRSNYRMQATLVSVWTNCFARLKTFWRTKQYTVGTSVIQ